MLKTGSYISKLSANSSEDSLSLYFTEGDAIRHELPRANMQDLVTGMTIFINQDSIQDNAQSDDISLFVAVYQKAQEIHNIRLQLEASGHPKHQGNEETLNENGQMDVAAFEDLYMYLKEQLENWEADLKQAYENHPRLLYLDCKQLPQLINQYSEIIKEDVSDTRVYAFLYPYISCCFPEYTAIQNGNTLLSSELIWEVYQETVEMYKKYQQKILDLHPLEQLSQPDFVDLSLIAHIITKIDDQIEELAHKQKYNCQPTQTRAPEKITAYNLSEWEIFRLIYELSEEFPPHPSQLMWCTSTITASYMDYFLQRVKKFEIPFIIVGVNKLQLAVRERLLNWISALFVDKLQEDVAPLYLVFTEAIGVEVFSFLKDTVKNNENIYGANRITTNKALNMSELKKNRNIHLFEAIHGSAASGKSHYIKKNLEKLRVTLFDSVKCTYIDLEPKCY